MAALYPRKMEFVGQILVLLGAVGGSLGAGASASAQLLYSFESGLEGWGDTGFSTSRFISIGNSSSGATHGTQSMVVEAAPTSGWTVFENVGPGDTALYNAFNTVASSLDQYTLDFDVTMTPESYAAIPLADRGSFFLLSVAMNSDSPNFPNVTNVTPNLNGLGAAQPVTVPVSIPMTSLPIATNSSYYQLTLGTNGNHTTPPTGPGVKFFVDNIRFTKLPELQEETIFSWETPDNPATPSVNEQFENWRTGFGAGHTHEIFSEWGSEGTSSLQIDRRTFTSPSFTWGSQFTLSSDVNPDPNVEVIDPTIQGLIDTLAGKISNAVAVKFDVRFDDEFPNEPPQNVNAFTRFGVHFSGETGFYDAEGGSFNGTIDVGAVGTVTIPLSNMVDNTSGMNLEDAGIPIGSRFLRIGISTNTNVAGLYQIDNFRLVSLVNPESADFDEDTDVDGLDFLAWQRGFGIVSGAELSDGDANGDGAVNELDLAIWEEQYGPGSPLMAATSAVPEPATGVLALLSCVLVSARRRRK